MWSPAPSSKPTPFGSALRQWRTSRGLSQIDLALAAETTSRHVSFLETGRSRPGSDMVDRLATALGLPLRERNGLFVTAGFAPAYNETALDAEDMAPFRKAVDMLLATHAPYPAYALDRHWNIVRTNRVAAMFLPAGDGHNAVELTYAGAWRGLIANWADLAWAGVRRLQAEAARFPHDPELTRLVALALAAARDVPEPARDPSLRVMCPHFRIGDQIIRTVSVVAQFGVPLDVTLDELRIELIYPGDAAAEEYFDSIDWPLDGES